MITAIVHLCWRFDACLVIGFRTVPSASEKIDKEIYIKVESVSNYNHEESRVKLCENVKEIWLVLF